MNMDELLKGINENLQKLVVAGKVEEVERLADALARRMTLLSEQDDENKDWVLRESLKDIVSRVVENNNSEYISGYTREEIDTVICELGFEFIRHAPCYDNIGESRDIYRSNEPDDIFTDEDTGNEVRLYRWLFLHHTCGRSSELYADWGENDEYAGAEY